MKINLFKIFIYILIFSTNLFASTKGNNIEDFFYNLRSLSTSFVQIAEKEKHRGEIWIIRGKNPKLKVTYKTGPIENIYMSGRFITIKDRKTKKERKYSILTTPLYAILSGNLDLKETNYSVQKTKSSINVIVQYDKKQKIILNFSHSNQLIGWTIDNITIKFDMDHYLINNKISDSIFTNK